MTSSLPQQNDPHLVNEEIDFGQLLGALWRGKAWIVLTGFLAVIAGGYYAFEVAIPTYTATATVVEDANQEPVVDFSAGLGGGGLGGDQSAINTEIEVLRSRSLLEKLVTELNLTMDPEFNPNLRDDPVISIGKAVATVRDLLNFAPVPPRILTQEQIRDVVVGHLRTTISVSNVRQSYVYMLIAETEDPVKSAVLVNTLAELYIDNQMNVKGESNIQATAWLTDRLSQLRIDLEIASSAVKDFKASSDLINGDTLEALSRQVKGLRERLTTVRADRVALVMRITELQTIPRDPQLMANVVQDRRLNRLFGEMSTQSATGRAAFDARFEQMLAQDILERDRLQSQIDTLVTSIAQQELTTDQQSTDLIQLQQLEREAEASTLLYEYFLNRLKETSVQSGIQTPDSRILSRAVEPLEASAPRKSIILTVSLMLGVMAGAALVLLRELMQNTFRAAEELEQRTGYTVLGQIPKIPARRRAKLLQYLTDKPTSVAAEAVRNMRTSVLLADVDNPPQIIMSTSSVPGEGKTTQSLSLTQNLAGLGKSVLLIEGDVRKRIFAEYFHIKDQNGLMAVLEGKLTLKDAAHYEVSLNADVLMSEKATSNAADIFSSQAFAALIAQARKDYDYIVIDTPPVLAVPDARIIGRHVDTTLYTVRWDNTTQRQVIQGLKELKQVKVPIAGLVLGQIDPKGLKRYGYGGQAYGGYHHN